jgi:riboflavin synthase
MFTGIVTDVGRVVSVADPGDRRFVLETRFDTGSIDIGASIACAGCCLTVVETAPGRFAVDASAETLSVTTLGDWRVGTEVNLERALRLGDELGGHLVSGHVDGVGRVDSVREEGASHRIVFEAPAGLARFVAAKGSIAVDGVSLTVNEVDGRRFGANIIPHTWTRTTFRRLAAGSRVNLEIDLLARYVARLMEPETSR